MKMTNKKMAAIKKRLPLTGYSVEELPGLWHWLCASGPSKHYPKKMVSEKTDNSLDFLD